jgi:hypothetical protein
MSRVKFEEDTMKRDQMESKFPALDGAERADPSDETVINGEPYDRQKANRSGAEKPTSPGLDAEQGKPI